MKPAIVIILFLVALAPILLLTSSRADAVVPDQPEVELGWSRYDLPVVEGVAERSWTFGPEPITDLLEEPAGENASETRLVQYFDKGRVDVIGTGTPQSIQFGNLVADLLTGRALIGENDTQERMPISTAVAGDADDPDGLTYAIVGTLKDLPPVAEGETVHTRVSADGTLQDDVELTAYGVVGAVLKQETNHRIASAFWEYLNSTGLVWSDSDYVTEPLFHDPLLVTGYPLTEAYWLSVELNDVERDVLLQCFQKRCLTFTPSNSPAWQVESNNVGRHYYDWLSGQPPTGETDEPDDGQAEEPDLPQAVFSTAKGEVHTMWLEVAATSGSRSCGLMHRDNLDADVGMLFVWEQDHAGSFWNCNTFVPLTLAWVSSEGRIIGLTDMEAQVRGQPQNVVSYSPPGTYRYVIEANQGWFEEHGVEIGDAVDLSEALARGDTTSDTLCEQLGLACR